MKKEEFDHIIAAAYGITKCDSFLVLGSQAILGNNDEKQLPQYLCKSQELNLAPIPDNQKVSDLIDGCLGDYSQFNEVFKIYAHTCDSTTVFFPDNWEERASTKIIEGCKVIVPSNEDLAIAKYIYNREKDKEYLKNMWEVNLINKDKIEFLLGILPLERINGEMVALVVNHVYSDIAKYCK